MARVFRFPLILASASPRRRDLLEGAGVDFEVLPSPAEELHDATMGPEVLCQRNAELKAEAVAIQCPDAVVIGSDTLVFIDQEPLGKPVDHGEARSMMRKLSGRKHRVCTAVCVIPPDGERRVFHQNTDVTFRQLSDDDIEAYFALVNPFDKAGAYGIQEHGERIVESIEGDFDNVMGLPVAKLIEVLDSL